MGRIDAFIAVNRTFLLTLGCSLLAGCDPQDGVCDLLIVRGCQQLWG